MCGMHRFMLFTIFMVALWIIKPPTKTSSMQVRYNEWHRWFVFGSCLWIKVYTPIENNLMSFHVFMWNKATFFSPGRGVCLYCTQEGTSPECAQSSQWQPDGTVLITQKRKYLDQPLLRWVAALLYTWEIAETSCSMQAQPWPCVTPLATQSMPLHKSVTSIPWTPPMTSNTGLTDPSFP